MAFLFQDQNQGIRIDAPRENAGVATVLFHPDFNRRLRNHTESADPSSKSKKALAGLGFLTLTAGGDFHPALRTSAARLSGLKRNYAQAQLCQQARLSRKMCMSAMPAKRDFAARLAAVALEINHCGKSAVDDSGLFQSLTARSRSTVDGARFACGRTPGGVARIPQITSLEPRKLWHGPELHPAATCRLSACRLA